MRICERPVCDVDAMCSPGVRGGQASIDVHLRFSADPFALLCITYCNCASTYVHMFVNVCMRICLSLCSQWDLWLQLCNWPPHPLLKFFFIFYHRHSVLRPCKYLHPCVRSTILHLYLIAIEMLFPYAPRWRCNFQIWNRCVFQFVGAVCSYHWGAGGSKSQWLVGLCKIFKNFFWLDIILVHCILVTLDLIVHNIRLAF